MGAYEDRMIELMEIIVARNDETVSQLANLRKELKEEISELRIELKSEISELREKTEAGLFDLLQEQQITNVRVESLEKQMIEVKTEIKGMKSEVSDMNSEIKEIKTDIKEMNFRLGNVEGQLSTVTKIAIINQDAMDRFENRISKLESEVFKKSA